MHDWSTRSAPPKHRGLNLLALLAGGVSALPLALLVAFTVHLVR